MPSQMMEIQSKDSCSIFNAADAQIHADRWQELPPHAGQNCGMVQTVRRSLQQPAGDAQDVNVVEFNICLGILCQEGDHHC